MSWATYCAGTTDEEGVREQDKTRLEEQGWQGVIVERIERMSNKNRVMGGKEREREYKVFLIRLLQLLIQLHLSANKLGHGLKLWHRIINSQPDRGHGCMPNNNKTHSTWGTKATTWPAHWHSIQNVLISNMMRDKNEVSRWIPKSNCIIHSDAKSPSKQSEQSFCSDSGGQHWKTNAKC